MKNAISLLLIFICAVSCQQEPGEMAGGNEGDVPTDAFEIFDFPTQTTYLETLSLYALDPDNYSKFETLLNGVAVDLFSTLTISEAGYYELELSAIASLDTIEQLFQFVILDPERGSSEWGLRKFTPAEIEDKNFHVSSLQFIYPKQFPKDLSLPIIFRAQVPEAELVDYYTHLTVDNRATTLKRGSGSILLGTERSEGSISVGINGGLMELSVMEPEPNFHTLGGLIASDTLLDVGGYYHINSDLTIGDDVTFSIPQGCIIKIDEAVNIYNNGKLIIEGNEEQPVVFVCSDSNSFWGGFISSGADKSIEIQHAIFTQSGFHNEGEYIYGHAKRQALFYLDQSQLTINHSYFIDNVGQIIYQENQSNVILENSLIQRAITAGEIVNSEIEINNSVFMDFPEYSDRFMDSDNDCLYLNQSNATIANSSFMWSKDDGIDSGAGGGGEVQITNCWFEGIFHEAIALSSQGTVFKNHDISHSVFVNNGQGIELGYSSLNHQVSVDNCHFSQNLIGVRYGDNYDWSVEGQMELTNYTFDNNIEHDIWNFVRSEWGGKLGKVTY